MQSTLTSSQGLAHGSVQSFRQSKLGRAVVIASATVFIAACAHVSVPLPFTPVPLTMQDLAVLLVGLALGPVDGFAALALYLAEGAAGIPVFNPQGLGGAAQLFGPTGGFLLAYPFVAAIAGWGARSIRMANSFARAAISCLLASAVLFGLGATWLAQYTHASAPMVLRMAVYPFLPGNLVKVAAASGIFSSLKRWRRD
jgi:biotin transport system substrate-specific component